MIISFVEADSGKGRRMENVKRKEVSTVNVKTEEKERKKGRLSSGDFPIFADFSRPFNPWLSFRMERVCALSECQIS